MKIWDEPPVALAWSPDGSRLAAAFHREGGSAIRLFDPATGALKSEARFAGRVSSVAWASGGELLAAAMEVKAYTFGGNVRQYLHRWRGTGPPVAVPLAETTVKLLTLRQAGDPATDCLPCHLLKTPAAVRQWEASAHAAARVGCADCHGSDHGRIDRGEARVELKLCGKCHPKALKEHTEASRLRARKAAVDLRPPTVAEDVEEELKVLRNRADRGAITPAEYELERRRLLERVIGPAKSR